jgi:hypothetical protein
LLGRNHGRLSSKIVIPSIPALPNISIWEELFDTSPIVGAKPVHEEPQKLILLGNEPGPLN